MQGNNFIGFDKYSLSGAYHWNSINNNEEYISQSNVIIEEILSKNPKSILDIGCGDGAIAGKLSKLLPHSEIYGFDAESSAITCATEKFKEFNINNVFLTVSNISDAIFLYRNKTFDAAFSLDVIEHLPNPFELLDFIKNFNIKTVLIGTPLFVGEEYMSPYHVKEYTKQELVEMFGKENILKEWILSGKRKSKITKNKYFFENNYYICSISL